MDYLNTSPVLISTYYNLYKEPPYLARVGLYYCVVSPLNNENVNNGFHASLLKHLCFILSII